MKLGTRWTDVALIVATVVCAITASGQQTGASVSLPQESAIQATKGLHDTDPALQQFLTLIEEARYDQAADQIRGYLQSHPDSARAHFLLGYALYREQKPRASLEEYTTGARFSKPAANDLAAVAMDYILLRDYADADKWLTQATAGDPQNELYLYYLARTKYVENRFEEAINLFRHCLNLAPHDLRAEYNLGLALEGLGRTDDAAAAYRTAIDWDRGSATPDAQPYLDLGILFLSENMQDQALPLLRRAVQMDPQNPRAHEKLGLAWQQSNNLSEADNELKAAVALAPDIPSLHFELGRIYQREGKTAKAKEEFARTAALNATHSTDAAETPNPAPQK